jgi:hypothetical protein
MRIPCLLSVLAVLLPGPGVIAQQAQRLPANGSFEELDAATGLPAGWTVWNPTHNLCAYTLARAHEGVAGASVRDDGPVASQGLRSPRAPITGGESYRATGYVWITDLEAGGFALYLEFWQGGQRVLDRSVTTTRRGEWVELSVAAIAPAQATEATILVYGSSATIGYAVFDDVSLVAVP